MRLREADLTLAVAWKDRCRRSLRFLMASVDARLENEVERMGSMSDNERLTSGPDAGETACQINDGCGPENRSRLAAFLNRVQSSKECAKVAPALR